ncbi:hypothetical protein, partial [Arcanobacterium phocae]|uniref:hypothetical protein n=1 Tax=Arcanobacterium phocae TaxID=131112 RepID=UPI001C10D358
SGTGPRRAASPRSTSPFPRGRSRAEPGPQKSPVEREGEGRGAGPRAGRGAITTAAGPYSFT